MLTQQQRDERKRYLCSSDLPAALGLSRWRSPFDVWLDKTGRLVEEESNDGPGGPMNAGSRFEGAVLDWADEWAGPIQERQAFIVLPEYRIASHIDAVNARREPIEAKTAGLFGQATGWGAEDTDDIPDEYVIQASVHLAVMPEAGVCWVPAFIGRRGFVRYRVERSDLADQLPSLAAAWWERHITNDTPPPGTGPSPGVAKLVRRQERIVPGDARLCEDWLSARAQLDTADRRLKEIESWIFAAMLDADQLDCGDAGRIHYRQSKRRDINAKALRAMQPAIADAFTRTTSYRTLVHKGDR